MIYYICSVGIFVCITLANIFIPICSLSALLEVVLHLISFATIFLIVLPLPIFFSVVKENEKKYFPFLFLTFFSAAPVFWSSMDRGHAFEKKSWNFEGEVDEIYVSSNHAAKSIIIKGKNYEFIPPHIWNNIIVGDTLSKSSCSDIIKINGKELAVVKQ